MTRDFNRNQCLEVGGDQPNVMAERTQLKQLENCIEALEFNMSQMQKAMIQSQEDMVAIKESIRELEKGQEKAKHHRQKINIMFNMFSALQLFHLLANLLPRIGLNLILDHGILRRLDGGPKVKDRLVLERENQGLLLPHFLVIHLCFDWKFQSLRGLNRDGGFVVVRDRKSVV